MIKLADNVLKLNVDSNVYLVDIGEKIIIDTGPRAYHNEVKEELNKITNFEEIKKVILTHIHYDHCGNIDLFPNAKIFASKKEIDDFKANPSVAFTLPKEIVDQLMKNLTDIEKIKDLLEKNSFEIIYVPGHTAGSMALYYKKENILFSGDCLFENGIGRYDLPNSIPKEVENSVDRLKKLNYRVLAAGHNY